MDRGHLVGAENLERGRIDPEDPWRLVVHATVGVQAPSTVHERRDRAVNGLVTVEQAVEEGRKVRNYDRDGDESRPQSELPGPDHRDLTISGPLFGLR